MSHSKARRGREGDIKRGREADREERGARERRRTEEAGLGRKVYLSIMIDMLIPLLRLIDIRKSIRQ